MSFWMPAKTTIESLIAMPTKPIVPTMAMKPSGKPKQYNDIGPNPITKPATEAMISAERNEPITATRAMTISEMVSVRFAARGRKAGDRHERPGMEKGRGQAPRWRAGAIWWTRQFVFRGSIGSALAWCLSPVFPVFVRPPCSPLLGACPPYSPVFRRLECKADQGV